MVEDLRLKKETTTRTIIIEKRITTALIEIKVTISIGNDVALDEVDVTSNGSIVTVICPDESGEPCFLRDCCISVASLSVTDESLSLSVEAINVVRT